MSWQPFDCAPKDGTEILVWNGKHYGVAHWYVRYESETMFKDVDIRRKDGKPNDYSRVPNPRAGKVAYQGWFIEWATSDDKDYDGNYEGPEPTDWRWLTKPRVSAS